MSYIAITSCRNEERYIKRAVESVLSQSIKPDIYLVVDDGSSDKTISILSKFKELRIVLLNNQRYKVRGINLALALNRGLFEALRLSLFSEYVLKLDADSIIPNDYVERLLLKFKEDEKLGIASGIPYGKKVWIDRASDGAKMYRIKCLQDMGTFFYPSNAFDTLAILKAKYNGWKVRSFENIKYVQLRDWERNKLSRWILSGRTRYYLGFPLWHTFLIMFIYIKHKPLIFGSLSMFLAHLITRLKKPKRPHGKGYYKFTKRYALIEALRRFHMKRII